MDFDVLSDLNWLGVILAALAYFALGGLWYSPAFLGKPWMAASGMTMPEDGQGPGPAIYAAPLVTCLVAAIATGMLAAATGTDTVSEGIVLGVVLGIGYAATIAGVTGVFESTKPNPKTWTLITAGYHVVGLVLAGIIVSLFD